MVRFVLSQAMLLALLAPNQNAVVNGVLYGDENFLDVNGGNFWAFYNGGIAVIDPETCKITKNITKDDNDQPLPTGWADGIYMQNKNEESSELEGYVMINARSSNAVYVVDTTKKEVTSVIEVGPRVVHSYGVYPQNEFWTHSDGDGHFYVINLEDLSKHNGNKVVQAHEELPFHGKLLWDEDGTLGNRGFGTSTGEPNLFEFDMKDGKYVQSYDYSDHMPDGVCGGLHAISYSAINQHVYAECSSGGGGIVEFDVSNGKIKYVHRHPQATGALYETPDGSYVVASNKGGSKLHIFKPDGTGTASSIEFDVNVPGNPSTVSFYPLKDGDASDTRRRTTRRKLGDGHDHVDNDYRICSPLTESANMNQRDENEIFCKYNDCTATTAEDVANGLCLYDETDPMKLKRVTEVVTSADTSMMGLCSACTNETAFDSTTNDCICTPNCGSCDANPDIDTSVAGGYACFVLSDIIEGKTLDATVIRNAGAVKQGSGYASSPECAFGRTYRSHKRGATKYDASVANYPHNSIIIFNMDTQQTQCEVRLAGAPSRVVYAPATPVDMPTKDDTTSGGATTKDDTTSGGATSVIATGLVAVAVMMMMMA